MQEHRTEIDARAPTFQAFEAFGQQLLQNKHYASDEIEEKLKAIADARRELEKSVFFLSNLKSNICAFFLFWHS